MRRRGFRTIPLWVVVVLLACQNPLSAGGAVGEAAPSFQLADTQGRTHSLEGHRGKVVVLEWINPNCPFTDRHAREKTMMELDQKYGEVVWLAINSTNPRSGDYLTPAQHQAWNDERGLTYPVLYDESGEVGRAYGAKTTPHMYVIDASGEIVYNGAIDDDPRGRTPKSERTNYVDLALTAVGNGGEPDPATTRPYGCSVKY